MDSDFYEGLEDMISGKHSDRGLGAVRLKGQLKQCVRSMYEGERIVIVTGFAIKNCGTGETDGPPGAMALCYALEKLNKSVVLVTDVYSKELLKAGADILGLKAEICIFEANREHFIANELVEKFKPDHVIGIERPGRGSDGRCYSMRGEDITDICPDTDVLFVLAKKMGIGTSAVGDGGNEVGMGKISDEVKLYVRNGEKICADFAADNLIVAGVSNWGAYALCAGLSDMSGQMLMYDDGMYDEVMTALIEAGAVDGCSKKREPTVDGISFDDNLRVYDDIRRMTESYVCALQYINN